VIVGPVLLSSTLEARYIHSEVKYNLLSLQLVILAHVFLPHYASMHRNMQ